MPGRNELQTPEHASIESTVYVSSSSVLQPKVKPECFPLSLMVSLFGFGVYEGNSISHLKQLNLFSL